MHGRHFLLLSAFRGNVDLADLSGTWWTSAILHEWTGIGYTPCPLSFRPLVII